MSRGKGSVADRHCDRTPCAAVGKKEEGKTQLTPGRPRSSVETV